MFKALVPSLAAGDHDRHVGDRAQARRLKGSPHAVGARHIVHFVSIIYGDVSWTLSAAEHEQTA